MKKLQQMFVVPALILTFFPGMAFGANTFEAAGIPDSLTATIGETFKTSFSFFYSGPENGLKASIINSNVPDGLALGSIIKNGVNSYSVSYSGMPRKAGDFPLTLILSDDSGLTFTKNFTIKVIGFVFPEETLLNAFVNQPYSTNIHFIYPGISRSSIRFYDFPENFQVSYNNAFGENGSFLLRFIPRQTGTFTFKGDVTVNSVRVATGKVFTINVLAPYVPGASTIKQKSPVTSPTKQTVPKQVTATKTAVTATPSGENVASSTNASSSAESVPPQASLGFFFRLWHWLSDLF